MQKRMPQWLQVMLMQLMLSTALCVLPASGTAQQFPTKAVRIVVPFPAGGAVDFTARIIAQKLGEEWRQTVVVENHAGANGWQRRLQMVTRCWSALLAFSPRTAFCTRT